MNKKKLLRSLFLGCMVIGSLFASEKKLDFKIVPFDYENVDMKEGLCAMVRDDHEIEKYLGFTEESMREALSGPGLQDELFVCRSLGDSAQVCGFIKCVPDYVACRTNQAFYITRGDDTFAEDEFKESVEKQGDFTPIERIKLIGYISRLAIHKDFRGKGLGMAMLEFAQEHFKKKGMQKLMLCCAIDNDKAVGLYRAFGFEIFEQDDESYAMMKSL